MDKNGEMISTCLGWNWCHILGHCVRRGSLTRWLSSHPWSSPAHHRTPCQSGLSLQAEEKRIFETLNWKSDDNQTRSRHCLLLYLQQIWPCGVFSAWRSTPWLWSQQSLLQSSLSHLSHPLQSNPAEAEGGCFFMFLKMLFLCVPQGLELLSKAALKVGHKVDETPAGLKQVHHLSDMGLI